MKMSMMLERAAVQPVQRLGVGGAPVHEEPLALPQHLWTPDGERSKCVGCSAAFGVFGPWKHHCRLCGEVFCDPCTSKVWPLGTESTPTAKTDSKVCDGCWDYLNKQSKEIKRH